MAKSKVGLGLALVVLMAPIGFLIGGLLSSFAVQQTGLAAVGVAFGYMVIGAVVAMVLGIVLAVYLPRERLKPMVGVAAVGALLIVAFIAFRIWQKQQEEAARQAEEAVELRPPVVPALPDAAFLSALLPLLLSYGLCVSLRPMTLQKINLLFLTMVLVQPVAAQEWPPSDEVPEAAEGFRQTTREEFQWRDDDWEAARRQFMHYDEAGRLMEIDYQSWFNDEWRTSRKETFAYEESLCVEKLTLERVANRLEKRGREVYEYDNEGRLQSTTLLGWSYEQKWEPIFKYSYVYDEAGRTQEQRKEHLNHELAPGAYIIRYEYEENGELDAAIHMREQDGDWIDQQRLDYRYDAEGQQVERAYQATRTNGTSWADMIKIQYDYNEEGRRATATTQGRGRTDGFEDTSRRIYEYDEHSNLTAKVIQFFREGTWQNGLKETYSYERIPSE